MYLSLKLLHIFCSILAFGCSLTYGVWALRGARQPQHEAFALRGIQFMDSWVANPAFGGLYLSGLGLVWLGGFAWNLAWVWQSTAALSATTLLAAFGYRPLLVRQIAALEARGPQDPDYLALTARGMKYGWVFTATNLYLMYLMVFKPTGL